MSKSKGYVVDPVQLTDRYGLDALRYYLLREVPFGSDGVFTPEGFVERTNYDLANDLGNLVNRTVAMIEKYFDGEIPAFVKGEEQFDIEIEQLGEETIKEVEAALDEMGFSVALTQIWKYVSRTNKYIDQTEPWVLAKDEEKRERLGNVMAHLVDSLRRIAILLQPFLTSTPERIFEQIGVTDDKDKTWDSLRSFGVSTEGAKVTKKDPIFPRLEVEKEVTIIKDMMRAPVEEKA